jgi:hypothetical protein
LASFTTIAIIIATANAVASSAVADEVVAVVISADPSLSELS